MSSTQKSIKVIKRQQRDEPPAEPELREDELKTESQTRREIINTITSWIEARKDTREELQRRDCLVLRNPTTETV